MRKLYPLLSICLLGTLLHAQNAYDSCETPLTIFPNWQFCIDDSQFNEYQLSNIGATPTASDAPLYNCPGGGDTQSEVADIWVSFVATGDRIVVNLESEDIDTFQVVLFKGLDCDVLTPVYCARGQQSGVLSFDLELQINFTYFLKISGGSPADQGAFSLRFQGEANCGGCYFLPLYNTTPIPENNTFQPGQTVDFYFLTEQVISPNNTEWLHSLLLEFGSGWDLNSLLPYPPSSCDGAGYWDWYEGWVSCANGEFYGPGFAYESSLGTGCGGTPLDGDPGNNWGDGNSNCGNFPHFFSFSLTVKDDDLPENRDLSIKYQVNTDGVTGSWTNPGCISGKDYYFLATRANGTTPYLSWENPSGTCLCDGSVSVWAAASGPQIYVLQENNGDTLYISQAVSDTLSIDGLCPNTYTLIATDTAANSEQEWIVEIAEIGIPTVIQVSPDTTICYGDTLHLEAAGGEAYLWSTGDTTALLSLNPNSTQGYQVTITDANGCAVIDSVLVTVNPLPLADAGPDQIACPGQTVVLNGQATVTTPFYQIGWDVPPFTNPLIINPLTSQQYTLEVIDDNGCSATDEVTVTINQPVATITAQPPEICLSETSTLEASGGIAYFWSNGQTGSSITVFPNSTTTYSVTVVDFVGCEGVGEITVVVNAPPDIVPVSCNSTLSSVTYEWPNAGPDFSYNVTGPAGILTDSSYTIEGLVPGTTQQIQLDIISPAGCVTSLNPECSTLSCPDVQISIDPVAPLCIYTPDPLIMLNASVSGGSGTGSGYFSGPGITDPSGLFDIAAAGIGIFNVCYTYEEDVCIYQSCIDLIVEAPLPAPAITCTNTSTSVTFSWDDIPGADGYDVLVVSGQNGFQTGNTFTVESLVAGEVVTIEVAAVGPDGCGNSVAELSCSALDCNNIEIMISPQIETCYANGPFGIAAQVSGGLGNGDFSWNSPCVPNPGTGVVDPAPLWCGQSSPDGHLYGRNVCCYC